MGFYEKLTPQQQEDTLACLGMLRIVSGDSDVHIVLDDKTYQLAPSAKEKLLKCFTYMRTSIGVPTEVVDAYMMRNANPLN